MAGASIRRRPADSRRRFAFLSLDCGVLRLCALRFAGNLVGFAESETAFRMRLAVGGRLRGACRGSIPSAMPMMAAEEGERGKRSTDLMTEAEAEEQAARSARPDLGESPASLEAAASPMVEVIAAVPLASALSDITPPKVLWLSRPPVAADRRGCEAAGFPGF